MKLKASISQSHLISLVPLVDVMMILLVFFMVTSTYLDLDMVPVVEQTDAPLVPSEPSPAEKSAASPFLIRLAADGQTWLRGEALNAASLDIAIKARLSEDADAPVIVLPSGQADVQALVDVMQAASDAGVTALRVVRIEARP
jgi:biopolymer transport protein ExbD